MSRTAKAWYLVASALNAMLMLLLVFVAMRLPYAHGDEKAIVEKLSIARRVFLGLDEKPSKDRFLFLDTQYDLELIDAIDTDGFKLGQQTITNRSRLGRLVQVLNAHPDSTRFVLLDLFLLDEAGPQDSLLRAELPRAKNLVGTRLPTALDPRKPFIDYPTAPAYYEDIEGDFYKYGLIGSGNEPSFALTFYNKLSGKDFSHSGITTTVDDQHYFMTFVPDFSIRAYDVLFAPYEKRYWYETLGNFVAQPDSALAAQAKGRIIVVGNFGPSDTHDTIYGDTPGVLILLNAVLALEAGKGGWGWIYLLFMFGCFMAISWQVLTPTELTEKLEVWLAKRTRWYDRLSGIVRASLLELVTYPLQLVIVSVISFVVFGVAVTILYLMYLLFLERQVIVWLARYRSARQ